MKIAKKLTALAVSSLMMFSVAGITASAATVTQDGLNVSLTTDKTEYKKDEAITATLTVENTGGASVKDVKLENVVPEGYELAKDYSLTKSVDELKSNDKAELKVVYNAKTGGNVTPSNNNTTTTNSTASTTASGASVDTVKTGDGTNAVVFAVILLISIGAGILCFKKKKGKEFLSIALCVSVLGTIIAVVPFEANAANSQMKSISIEDVINIDGNKVTVKASVPYSHEDTEYGEIYSYPIEEEHVHETADGTKYLDNEILVVVKDGITRQQVDELAKKYDSVVVGAITVSGDYQLKLNNMVSNEELIKLIDNIGQESIIDSCSLNYIEVYSSDTIDQWAGFYYGDEWKSDLQNNSDAKGKSWGIEAINTFAAWKQLTDNSNNVNPVKVGVVDGGFDSTHPDLGFRDLYYENGKNKVSSNAEDKNHGTHVSGTFAANTNDNTGICGVYPYGRNNLYAVSSTNVRKYTENGDWLTSVMHEKISYAELIVRNVKVINQSQGFNWYINKFATKDSQDNIISIDYIGLRNWVNTYNFDKEKKEAKLFADFLNRMLLKGYEFVIVCAAGNDSHSSIGHLESEFMSWNNIISKNDYPAVYDRIIVVGSINDQFSISPFSNVGKRTDVFAPGENIYSTYCVDKNTLVSKPYEYLYGTSMASPHVAGVAAMVWSANNDLTGAQVKEIVCKDSNKNTRCTSCKMVDANLSVQDSFRTKGSKPSTNPDNVVAMGFVLNEDTNAAIANKTIEFHSSVSSSVYTATTDKDGHYEISLPKEEYHIVAEIDNYKPFSRTVNINSDGVNYLDKILLKRIWTYEITVTDEKDNLLSGVNVVLYDSKGNKCVDINTKNGKCSFKVENSPNTTYSMWLTKEGYVWLNLQSFEINSNDNLTFKLKEDNKAKDSIISGKVVTENNKPIENAKVTANNKEVYTNANGEFSLSLPKGNYYFEVACDGYQPAKIANINVQPGKTTKLNNIVLKKENEQDYKSAFIQALLDNESEWNKEEYDGLKLLDTYFFDVDFDGKPELLTKFGDHNYRTYKTYVYYYENGLKKYKSPISDGMNRFEVFLDTKSQKHILRGKNYSGTMMGAGGTHYFDIEINRESSKSTLYACDSWIRDPSSLEVTHTYYKYNNVTYTTLEEAYNSKIEITEDEYNKIMAEKSEGLEPVFVDYESLHSGDYGKYNAAQKKSALEKAYDSFCIVQRSDQIQYYNGKRYYTIEQNLNISYPKFDFSQARPDYVALPSLSGSIDGSEFKSSKFSFDNFIIADDKIYFTKQYPFDGPCNTANLYVCDINGKNIALICEHVFSRFVYSNGNIYFQHENAGVYDSGTGSDGFERTNKDTYNIATGKITGHSHNFDLEFQGKIMKWWPNSVSDTRRFYDGAFYYVKSYPQERDSNAGNMRLHLKTSDNKDYVVGRWWNQAI